MVLNFTVVFYVEFQQQQQTGLLLNHIAVKYWIA